MKKLFYTIFAAIFALSTAQSGAMEMFPVEQEQVSAKISTSEALKRDAKRLGFWTGCVGLSAVTGGIFVRVHDVAPRRAVTAHQYTPYETTAVHEVLGILAYSSLGVAGLFCAALAADSARMITKWLPKALYPWSGLTRSERIKALGLSAVSAGSVGLAVYRGY